MTDIDITIGTRVAFKRAFLQSTGQFTGWVPFARGVVIDELKSVPGIVSIKWDDRRRIAGEANPVFSRANVNNLVREDRIHLEPV
jgi:hypothetical protein